MLFSEVYDISIDEDEEWFDPILTHDTPLFIDPFLIFKTRHPYFKEGHKIILSFFEKAFFLGAQSGGDKGHLAYQKLGNMLVFPEVSELCLGYTGISTSGSGSSSMFSRMIRNQMIESIKMGIKKLEHFEVLGILDKGIGCDRISDMTANILKQNLISYTQDICKGYEIKMRKIPQRIFDFKFTRWEFPQVDLPYNKETGECVLLVPKEFLRELPTINHSDFWDYCWDYKSHKLRTDFNYEIKSGTNKEDVIKVARERRNWLFEFMGIQEDSPPHPYELERDPKLLYKWYRATKDYLSRTAAKEAHVSNEKEFMAALEDMTLAFRHYVEQQGGHELLWNNEKTKFLSEKTAQLLFKGIVINYCKPRGIVVSREVDVGRGSVDFQFASGYKNRVLLEMKLANSPKLQSGLESQLPQYLESESVDIGYYVVIVSKKEQFEKVNSLRDSLEKVKKKTGCDLRIISVNATLEKPSASKQ